LIPSTRSYKRNWLRQLVLLSTLLFSYAHVGRALAAFNEAPVIYAGFAFAGDEHNREKLYPYSIEISSDVDLDKILREKLLSRPELAQKVSFEMSDGKLDQSSVAFSLVQETIETQIVDGKFLVIVTLQANVLAFNRASKSVVATYPVRMRATRALDAEPNRAELKEMVREMYTASLAKDNIFDQWLSRFEKTRIREGAIKRLRVTNITVTPEADRVIVDAGKNVASIQDQTAKFLESAVAENFGIPMIPSSVGEAIGKKMRLRFSDESTLDLSLPEPDLALSFTIRDFVTKKLETTETTQDIYRVKANISMKNLGSERIILNEGVYDTNIVVLPKSAGSKLSDWDQYFKLMQALISKLGKQMANVSDEWLEESASRAMDAKPAFLNLKQELLGLR